MKTAAYKLRLRLLHILGLAVLTPGAMAQGAMHNVAAIEDAVRQYVAATLVSKPGVRTNIEIAGVDPRLRLKRCDQSLSIKTQNKSVSGNRRSIQVSCPGAASWSIYVPVSIGQFGKVMVLRKHLRRNTEIGLDDLGESEMQLDHLPSGYFMQAQDVVGMFTRRNLRSGMVLAPKHLRPPHIVRKGENVTIRAVVSGVEVKMNGTAMDNGALGDMINIVNNSSKRAVEAEVIRPGVVQVRL